VKRVLNNLMREKVGQEEKEKEAPADLVLLTNRNRKMSDATSR
jgi:hypothetical protein